MKNIYLLPLFFSLSALAQDGIPDATFGSSGRVTTSFGQYWTDQGNDIVVQSDGKIISIGISNDPNTGLDNISAVRYTIAGSLDAGYGNGGKILTSPFPNFNCGAYAGALQSDGKLLVLATAIDTATINPQNGFIIVYRFSNIGTPDSSFGSNGRFIWQVPSMDAEIFASDIIVQNDSHIVVCGAASINNVDGDMIFIRLQENGSPDSTFGTNGMAILAPAGGGLYPQEMALQTDNKIAVCGLIDAQTNNDPFMTRLDTNGTIDSNFGLSGYVFPVYGFSSGFSGLKLQSDGKLVVCGFDDNGAMIARFHDDGLPDNTFGTNGVIVQPIGNQQDAIFEDLLIMNDGKIVASGYADNQFALMRVKTNGDRDSTFGVNGITQTAFSGAFLSMGTAMAIQTDQKILVTGVAVSTNVNAPTVYATARYMNSLFTSFPATASTDISVTVISNNLEVKLPSTGYSTEHTLELYNAEGKCAIRQMLNNPVSYVSLEGLVNGLYTAVISDDNGITSKAFVLSR